MSAFPRSAWLAATRRALGAASYESLDYADPRGLPELRVALADYVSRARGVRATPDHVVVCSGFTQGFRLLCEMLRAEGAEKLAIERYIQPATAQAAAASGLSLAPLDVDDEGAAVERLGAADAALLTPAQQFPIGAPLVARRRAIDQLTLAQLVASGAYDRHIRRSRLIYRRRRDRLVAALGRQTPRVRISGIAAGLHALAELPGGVREEDVVAPAAERGLYVQGLGGYAHGAHMHAPALVVGYAKPPEHAFTGALARLAAVLRDATG